MQNMEIPWHTIQICGKSFNVYRNKWYVLILKDQEAKILVEVQGIHAMKELGLT